MGVEIVAKSVPGVKILALDHNKGVTDASLDFVAKYCTSLKEIGLEGTRTTDTGKESLRRKSHTSQNFAIWCRSCQCHWRAPNL